MKPLIICISGLLCGIRLLAVQPLFPETFLTREGIYHGTDADITRELTIQTNKLWLNACTGHQSTDAGSYNWVPTHGWFVYVAKDMRLWAWNGERFFILLEADARSARTVPLASLQEEPPAPVVNRLPRSMRKLLAAPRSPQPNKDDAVKGRQAIRSEPSRASAVTGSDR